MKSRVIAWAILIVGMAWSRWDFLDGVIYNVDEAEYAVAADGLSEGWLPGADLLGSTKPPGIALLYRLIFDIGGRSLTPVHVAGAAMTAVAGALLIEIAIAMLGLAAAIPCALLFWTFSNVFGPPSESLVLNVETPQMLFALGALALLSRSRNPRIVLAAGFLLGCSTLFRQSSLLFLVPALLLARRANLLRLLAGFVTAWIPLLAIYTVQGKLTWAWDSWVRYPLVYAGDLGVAGTLSALILNTADFVRDAWPAIIISVTGLVLVIRGRGEQRFRWMLIFFVVSFLALCSGSRFYGHYWIQFYPALVLAGSAAVLYLAAFAGWSRVMIISLLCLAMYTGATHFPLWYERNPRAPGPGISEFALGRDSQERAVAGYAREHTREHERIVVWGYCPQIYFLADRLPGVRDYLCHYITGFSTSAFDPWTSRAPRANSHPRAEEMFVSDITTRRPQLIFDLVQITDYSLTFYQYSLRTYPRLSAYLKENYTPRGKVGDVFVYARTDSVPESQTSAE